MVDISKAIEEKRRKVQQLRSIIEELAKEEKELVILEQALLILDGKGTRENGAALSQEAGAPSIAGRVEQILKAHGELRVSEIWKFLDQQGFKVSKQVLMSAVARQAGKGRRFTRVRPGVYAVIEAKQ